MPISSGTSRLPPVSRPAHVRRQATLSRLPRNSNEVPRAISAASSSTMARYMPENQVAYQPGKAAKVAAPATISHTSLPSHSGPIVLITVRRPASSRPTMLCSMPTPRSNPSSTKNPVHSTVMRMNQNWASVMAAVSPQSVQHRGHAGVRFAGRPGQGRVRLGFAARVAQHEHQEQRRQGDVDRDEDDQADDQGGGADRGGDPVLGEHEALHDPRLAAALGEEPARGVHQERRDDGPGGGEQEQA